MHGQRIADCSDSRKHLIHHVEVPPAGCGPPDMLSVVESGRDLDEGVNDERLVNRRGAFDVERPAILDGPLVLIDVVVGEARSPFREHHRHRVQDRPAEANRSGVRPPALRW